MATSLRDQFKATSTKELKNLVEHEDTQIATKRITDTYDFVDGINKLRLFPKHPGEKNFYHILCQHWLTIEGDDGPMRRTVPNARMHGGFEKALIDEYILMCKTNLSTGDADDSAKLKALTSYEKGIHMQSSWLAYANAIDKQQNKEFTLLEFKKTIRDALNDESIIEDASEAIDADPFTGPDDGKPILVTYNSKAKKAKDYYKVQVSKTAMPLTDEELEKFANVTPLSQLSQVQYTMQNFETELEGLKYFDDENEIGLFDTEEFQAIIEEVKAQFDTAAKPAAKEVAKKPTQSAAAPAGKKGIDFSKKLAKAPPAEELLEEEQQEEELEEQLEEEQQEEEFLNPFDSMDRNELKKYIKENSLEIKVYTTTTDDSLRQQLTELIYPAKELEQEEEPEPELEEEQEEAPPAKVVKTVAKPAAAAVKKPAVVEGKKAGALTLDQIKANLRAQQKK